MSNLVAVVLAGGKGTRMKSDIPKVLHPISGKPMIFYTLENLKRAGIENVVVVVGHQAGLVQTAIEKNFPGCRFAVQENPIGTADALKSALPKISVEAKDILLLNGDDSAFYNSDTLNDFINSHRSFQADVSVMIAQADEKRRIGRVIRDDLGKFMMILEANEYEQSNYTSQEINCGAYIFKKDWVKEKIGNVKKSLSGEYYITDLLNIAQEKDNKVNLFKLNNGREWSGVNTQEELALANALMQKHE
jgi:bifunctional UDP-N-acetylglucosamine pyrophosphorylase / glucosamine-1-phosphate N-acetyltransferase